MTETILAIDNGTQSVRALLFDLKGNLLEKVQVPIKPYVSPKPNWAEQDPLVFWEAVCQACQGLWEKGVQKERITAVTLTTQRGTVINVDANGNHLRPAIVWLDQRRTNGVPRVGGLWALAFRLIGMAETVAYFQAEAEVNWLQTHQPDIWDKTHKYLFLSGYLTHKLTGEFVDSVGCQVGYVPFDYKKHTWASRFDWKWQALMHPDKSKLPDLKPVGAQLGAITQHASQQTGLPVGLPVMAAAADKACEVIGAGCLTPSRACLSYGTTATINTTHQRYLEAIPFVPPYPAALPHAYSVEIQIYRGYWMVSWFKEEFGLREQLLADETDLPPEAFFDDLVRQVPAGSEGLLLQPYWSPGIKLPGPEAKGAIIGFSDVHTRAHIYRAILEGLAYALREGLERTVKRSKRPVSELRVVGGGSQSDAAMQLTADIFNLPAIRPHTFEASGLGAAIDTAVGMGLHGDFETAVKEMSHIGKTFEPNSQTHHIYDQLYHGVYKQMYKRLKPLYEELWKITG